MSVTQEKVARIESWAGVRVVVGWELSAPCGCKCFEGMRLDRDPLEPIIGFKPCEDEVHELRITAMTAEYELEARAREENGAVTPDDERPLHDVLVERFTEALDV